MLGVIFRKLLMNCCDELQEIYEGLAVKDIPDLFTKVEKTSVNYKLWVTSFKCSKCGQIWKEQYVSTGHGDVPRVYKNNSALKSNNHGVERDAK
jgi:hypothetical protein